MADVTEHTTTTEGLALQVVGLALSEVIAANHFLAAASGLLTPACAHVGTAAFACDGETLACDPDLVLEAFSRSRVAPTREVLHVLLHCILLHPFVGADIDRRLWSLACDISVEGLVAEILGPAADERAKAQGAVARRLASELGRSLTAERIYRALRNGIAGSDLKVWEQTFRVDDHTPWYPERKQGGKAQDTPDMPDAPMPNLSRDDDDQGAAGRAVAQEGDGEGAADDASLPDELPEEAPSLPSMTDERREQLREAWEQASKSMRVDLETLSRIHGDRLAGLMRELEVSQHETVDYREFLRQFAIRQEDLHLSDEEFDYVFYTYGLELYDDMPLIEPLEYRSSVRIRDFVIVIDTSSSVTSRIVQNFVDATFDVLSSTGSFFETVNVHIVQCDMRVQSDTKITSLNELDRWRRNIKLLGFGGTDFRPAFRYINELVGRGEFQDLGGVIYFTDGWGIYPERMPPYKTAFVFYDEDHRPDLVPAWAIQLTLRPGEFESMSVYH